MEEYSFVIIFIVFVIVLIVPYIRLTKGPRGAMERVMGQLATKFIQQMLEQAREKIISGGYENWTCDEYKAEFALPEAELFRCHLSVKKLLFTGASSFVTNHVRYDVPTSKVLFDVTVPKLFFAVGDGSVGTILFEKSLDAQVKGWVTFFEFRIYGEIVLDVDEDGNIKTNGFDVNVKLKEVQSKVKLNFLGNDYSDTVNNFLTKTVPVLINTYLSQFKSQIEGFMKTMAEPLLAKMI